MTEPPENGPQYSDAARRCSDIVNMHVAAGVWNKFVAIRLSDGGSDGVVYDTKADAVRHQLHETLCAYVFITPDGMSHRSAENFLRVNRQLYDAGMRLSDPAKEVLAPQTTLDQIWRRR